MDQENTLAAPPQGQEVGSAPAAEPDAKPADGQEGQAGAPQEAPEEKRETPKGVQKRLDELTRRINDERREKERLLALVEASLIKGEKPQVQAPNQPPKRDDFESYEAYLEAKADYQIAQRLEGIERKAAEAKAKEAVQARESTWIQRVESASSKYEDFDEVVFADNLPITPVMAEAFKDSDVGPDVAYWLGKNPAEARRIAQLPPVAQVREIGKIEARLVNVQPAPKPVSKAPAPIEPVGTPKSTASGDLAKLPMEEYIARRKQMGAGWAR